MTDTPTDRESVERVKSEAMTLEAHGSLWVHSIDYAALLAAKEAAEAERDALRRKLKAVSLQQQLFNAAGLDIVAYGATINRLKALENAWERLKEAAADTLDQPKDGKDDER